MCKLDRGVVTTCFINKFSPISVLHLPRYHSYHAAICIDLEYALEDSYKRCTHIFIFKEVWSRDPICDFFWKLWNWNEVQGHNKLKSIQGLEDFFKEYKIMTVSKDIKRIEALLKEDVRWSVNP